MIRSIVPPDVKVQTGQQQADEQAKDISNSINSFLGPALLAFAGAALLVGAFIIFNTFSISVAERTREFASLRTLGATRGQVLRSVTTEALVIGVLASVAGLFGGLLFARAIGALFKAAGAGIPTSDLGLKTRTVVVALSVGIGITLLAALGPAVRATRIQPALALQEGARVAPSRVSRLAPYLAGVVTVGGLGLLVYGLFGSGPATDKLLGMAGGAVLLFIGLALVARYIVRPIAATLGLPLERLFAVVGRLARENAQRNPGRTALTAAALMVGLGLVVFVAVFTAGLKASIERLRSTGDHRPDRGPGRQRRPPADPSTHPGDRGERSRAWRDQRGPLRPGRGQRKAFEHPLRRPRAASNPPGSPPATASTGSTAPARRSRGCTGTTR